MDSNAFQTSDVFSKTPKGTQALTEHGALPPRARTCLVLINGLRSLGDLSQMLPGSEINVLLQQLTTLGMIERVRSASARDNTSAARPAERNVERSAVAERSATERADATATEAGGAQALKDLPLAQIRSQLCHSLIETLGPSADLMTARVEAASLEEIPELINTLQNAVKNLAGSAKAKLFRQQIEQQLYE